MSASLEPTITEQVTLQLAVESLASPQTPESFHRSKHVLGRAALIFALATASATGLIGESLITAERAEAATTFTNDYPDLNASVYNINTYDWWIDENDNGRPDVTPSPTDNDETMSARGYGYRNCTDGVAYWVAKYTGVNIAGWGNAKDWNTSAASANYEMYDGNTNNIEPGDIAQDDTGDFGHVGFITDVVKNSDGTVASMDVAELNKAATGAYTKTTYNTRDAAGNFVRNTGKTWDHIIDVNGAGKGLNNESISNGTGGGNTQSGPTFMPAMIQRPSGETDVAVVGPANSLMFYYNFAGNNNWYPVAVPNGQAYSTPAMVQRPGGETDIAVQGPGNSMDFYYNAQGSPNWGISHVAVPGWAYSAPAVVQRPSGETDIAVEGPNNELDFYINAPGSPLWSEMAITGDGTTYSAPAIIQRPSGETDVAVLGPNNTMDFYYNFAGNSTWYVSHVASPNETYSTPAIVQRPNGETDIAVQGPNNKLDLYINIQGSPLWGKVTAAGAGSTYGAPNPPAMVQRASGETDIAVQGAGNQADIYYNAQGSTQWGESVAAVGGYAVRQPAIAQRANTGETDLAVIGPNNRLDFYLNAQNQPLWGYVPVAGNNSAS